MPLPILPIESQILPHLRQGSEKRAMIFEEGQTDTAALSPYPTKDANDQRPSSASLSGVIRQRELYQRASPLKTGVRPNIPGNTRARHWYYYSLLLISIRLLSREEI